jgi:hypothetical protein
MMWSLRGANAVSEFARDPANAFAARFGAPDGFYLICRDAKAT